MQYFHDQLRALSASSAQLSSFQSPFPSDFASTRGLGGDSSGRTDERERERSEHQTSGARAAGEGGEDSAEEQFIDRFSLQLARGIFTMAACSLLGPALLSSGPVPPTAPFAPFVSGLALTAVTQLPPPAAPAHPLPVHSPSGEGDGIEERGRRRIEKQELEQVLAHFEDLLAREEFARLAEQLKIFLLNLRQQGVGATTCVLVVGILADTLFEAVISRDFYFNFLLTDADFRNDLLSIARSLEHPVCGFLQTLS